MYIRDKNSQQFCFTFIINAGRAIFNRFLLRINCNVLLNRFKKEKEYSPGKKLRECALIGYRLNVILPVDSYSSALEMSV